MNTNHSLHLLGLVQMLQQIESGEHSALDFIHACFDRLEARESEVGAWQFRLTRAEYLQIYEQNREQFELSLLKGLPVGIKDIIDTKGMPTEMGSPIHAGRIPVDDATCVDLIKQAGGLVLGKTVTTEFAYFKAGKTRNPADLTRTPGGSSSGSAAAVADSMIPVSVGSQTAASVIRPAAYCGAIGYVASRGEFSLRGGQPLAQSLDSLGLYARKIEDIQLLRAILLRLPSVTLNLPQPVKPARLLVCPGPLVGAVSSVMETALTQLSEHLSASGVQIDILEDHGNIRRLVRCHEQIMAWEVCRNLAYESRTPAQFSEPLQKLIESGLSMDRRDYLSALTQVDELSVWLKQIMGDADAILTPAAPGVAPLASEGTGSPHMSRPWQVLGLPTVTIAGLTDPQGLPLGLQLVGHQRDDDHLLQIAGWVSGLAK